MHTDATGTATEATVSREDWRRWIVGLIVGTFLVGMTSPWFVRSYVPRRFDSERQAVVLETGHRYRWRSEGYATTLIGPYGMPGQQSVAGRTPSRDLLCLWGDSQAEGVSVDDAEKIHAFIERQSSDGVIALPFARSGDNCNDWIRQIEAIDSESSSIDADAHVILVVEWSDWMLPIKKDLETVHPVANLTTRYFPAFVIQAARNVFTDGRTNERRALRFRPGPVGRIDRQVAVANGDPCEAIAVQLARLRSATARRCVLVYAPMLPAIVSGKIVWSDDRRELHDRILRTAIEHGLEVIDLRADLRALVRRGYWPRGFHNGRFGDGHYNSLGNAWIAKRIVRWWNQKGSKDKEPLVKDSKL